MTRGQVLETATDFNNAISSGVEICVTQDGLHLGSGRIMFHTDHSVKMLNCCFFKDGCEFKVNISLAHTNAHEREE